MLSQGPFSYNRFDQMDALYQKVYEAKKAAKDYDGDGKVESGSEEYLGSRDKAIKKAMGKSVKEADDKKDLPPFMKDKKDDKKDKGCTCKEWVEDLVQQGYDLSEYTMEEMEIMFEENKIQYPTGPKQSFTKSKKDPKVAAGREAAKKMGLKMNEQSHIQYPKGPKMSFTKSKKDPKVAAGREAAKKMGLKMNEENLKEQVCQYLIGEGYTNNEVSAEVLFNHMSEEWLNTVIGNIVELYKGKHGQTAKQYAASRSRGGKMISGDDKMSGAEYTHGRRVKAANPGMQPDVGGSTKPKSQGRMTNADRADLQYSKANMKKG